MQLPEYLRHAIEQQAQGLPLTGIADAAANLSSSYRESLRHPITYPLQRIAYLVTRFPSTYASARAVLFDTYERFPVDRIESILDLGAGPGTASHAAMEIFPAVRRITVMEQDPGWIELGKSLANESPYVPLRAASWQPLDLTRETSLPVHDLVLLSYVVGELDESHMRDVVRMAWEAARHALVIVEPGTPRAFSRVRFLRDVLLHAGAHIMGPCPHEAACPMGLPASRSPLAAEERAPRKEPRNKKVPTPEAIDWCHFAARVERTSLHRRAKGGTLGFEDEKYSYLVVSRTPVTQPLARIVRRPIHTSGSVVLSLCTKDGLKSQAVSRGNKSLFREAKKALWGQIWESSEEKTPKDPLSSQATKSPQVSDSVGEKAAGLALGLE